MVVVVVAVVTAAASEFHAAFLLLHIRPWVLSRTSKLKDLNAGRERLPQNGDPNCSVQRT